MAHSVSPNQAIARGLEIAEQLEKQLLSGGFSAMLNKNPEKTTEQNSKQNIQNFSHIFFFSESRFSFRFFKFFLKAQLQDAEFHHIKKFEQGQITHQHSLYIIDVDNIKTMQNSLASFMHKEAQNCIMLSGNKDNLPSIFEGEEKNDEARIFHKSDKESLLKYLN